MQAAGASCLALDAEKCLLLDGERIIEAADAAGIAVLADATVGDRGGTL
jgi:DUF1009 family protein